MGLFGGGGGDSGASRLSKLAVQDVGYGTPIKICYGVNRVSPILGLVVDFKATEHEQGGKGTGGGGGSYFTYSATVMFYVCEGVIQGFGKIWKDKKIFTSLALAGFSFSKTGTTGQAIWGTLGTKPEAMSYSNTALFAGSAYDLGQQATVGNHSIEVRGRCLSTVSTDENYNGAFVGDVISDFITNPRYGVVDANTYTIPLEMTQMSSFCAARGILINPVIEDKKPAHEYITEWATVANSGIVWSDGKLKIIPYADEDAANPYAYYTADTTIRADFNDDNLEELISPQRKKPADCYNKVTIECLNNLKDYNKYPAEASDQGMIEQYGLRVADTVTMTSITSVTMAKLVAHTILQRGLYIRNTYTLKTFCTYGYLLEPMDFVTITDASLGLSLARCRITSITDEPDGKLTVEVEEAPTGVYSG